MSGVAALMRLSTEGVDHRGLVEAMIARLGHRGIHRVVQENELGAVAQCSHEASRGLAVSSDRQRFAVADTHLDNRAELTRALRLGDGSPLLRGAEDAALILAAYEAWGHDCVARLHGDFAFCILDAEARELFGARDRFGIRTLYYREDGRLFRCATEMAALFADPAVPRRPELRQVALFLDDEYTETDETLYEGIRVIPPAHRFVVSERGLQVERYWEPRPSRMLHDDEGFARELRESLLEATRDRVRACGTVGVFLSGGTDSAAVAALVEQVRREGSGPSDKPLVLHAAFPGLADDETSYSDAVADMWDLPRINARPLDDHEATRPAPIEGHPDIPYDPRNALWLPLLRSASERGVRVALTGEGGDDFLQLSGVEIASALATGRWSDALRMSGIATRPFARSSWLALWRNGLRHLIPPRVRRLLVNRWSHVGVHEVLAPSYAAMVTEHRRRRAHRESDARFGDLNDGVLCTLLARSYGHAALAWADRISALHGIRLRHPFHDHRVVELLLAMPHEQRHTVGLDKPKPVLRRAMRGLLPESVLTRTESGNYMEYLRRVLLEKHRSSVEALLASSRLEEAGLIRSDAQLASFDPHAPGGAVRLMRLRTAVAMEIWLRQV